MKILLKPVRERCNFGYERHYQSDGLYVETPEQFRTVLCRTFWPGFLKDAGGGSASVAPISLKVHNIVLLGMAGWDEKLKTPLAACEHRKGGKDLLVGFNIPADWAG